MYEFVNEAYYQLVGHRDILGKPLLEAIPEIRDQGFDALLKRVLETGEPWVGRESPVLLQRTPGAALETRYLDMVFQRLSEADGTHSGVVAHGSDITEQVLARHEVERARDRADRLQRLTAALAATSTPTAVADVVAEQGVVVGAATAMLALREAAESDDGEDHLVILRQTGVAEDLMATYRRYPLSSATPTATSVRSGSPLFVEDGATLRASFATLTSVWDTLGTQAVVSVPLAVGNEVVGGISFSYATPHEFPEEERSFFLALGRQVAQAIERVRLSEAEHTARDRAEALQRVTATLARARTLGDVGRVFSHELTTLVGADTAWVGVVVPDSGVVQALGWSGYPDTAADQWRRLPLDAPVALTEAVRSARPQWWTSREAVVARYPSRAGVIRSISQEGVAVLPILPGGERDTSEDAAGRAIGGIVVGYLTPQHFDASRRSFFLALAQQCGSPSSAHARTRPSRPRGSRRSGASLRRGGQPRQERVPRGDEPRAAHAAERHRRLRGADRDGDARPGHDGAARGPRAHPAQPAAPARAHQRACSTTRGSRRARCSYDLARASSCDDVLATCEALVAPQAHAKRLALRRWARRRTT